MTVEGPGGTVTYTWDASGNRVRKEAPGSVTTYTWSAEDRLKEVRLPGGGIVTNTYRPDGLRHSREDASGLQGLVWDGDEVLSVEGAAPQLFVKGVDLARAEGAGIDRTYHLDALGTTEALTGGSQAVETRYSLDAWGNVVSGSASGNPYVYHGGLGYWREADAGLDYVRARWLDPDTGSWLSVDPVSGEPRYAYVANRPTRDVDPSGRAGEPGWWQQWWEQEGQYNAAGLAAVFDPRNLSRIPENVEISARWLENQVQSLKNQGEFLWRSAAYTTFNKLMETGAGPPDAQKVIRTALQALGPAGQLLVFTPAATRAIAAQLPSGLRSLAPPPATHPAIVLFAAGFLWAVIDFLIEMALPHGTLIDLLKLIAYLGKGPDVWADMVEYGRSAFSGVFAFLEGDGGASGLNSYERGKAAGTLLTTLVGVVRVLRRPGGIARRSGSRIRDELGKQGGGGAGAGKPSPRRGEAGRQQGSGKPAKGITGQSPKDPAVMPQAEAAQASQIEAKASEKLTRIQADARSRTARAKAPVLTWQQTRQVVDQLLRAELDAIRGALREIDPDLRVGYRGSLVTGARHTGQPFDPNDWDVDAFIVSDELARQLPGRWKNIRTLRNPELKQRLNQLQLRLSEMHGYRVERGKPFTFRVYSSSQYERLSDSKHILE